MSSGFINTDLKAWDVRYHPRDKAYWFVLRDEYKFKQDTYLTVTVRLSGKKPLVVINQANEPSNPAMYGDAMTEFLGFNDFIQKHQRELDEIPF